jgi:hypothetical protein
MVSVADIKNDLPDWPEDVIEQWLLYFANEPDCGWPPPDPLGDHRWNGPLGGNPLSWWKNVTWEKETVTCDLASLTAKARADVSDIIVEMDTKTADATTQKRVAKPWIYIKDNAAFPRSLVTMKKPDGLSLIDGTHRIAAFRMIQRLTDAQLAKLNAQRPALKQEVGSASIIEAKCPTVSLRRPGAG